MKTKLQQSLLTSLALLKLMGWQITRLREQEMLHYEHVCTKILSLPSKICNPSAAISLSEILGLAEVRQDIFDNMPQELLSLSRDARRFDFSFFDGKVVVNGGNYEVYYYRAKKQPQ